MIKKVSILSAALCTGSIAITTAMNIQTEQPKPQSLILRIPGGNGYGGNNIRTVFPFCQKKNILTIVNPTGLSVDLGQSYCLERINDGLGFVNPHHKYNLIAHATSLGTASGLIFAGKNPNIFKAVLLEGVMLSGNSAISYHAAKDFPITNYIPLRDYILPYIAKCFVYPFYSPAGDQPILNAQQIPHTIPIIIVHCQTDKQLPIEHAQALYAGLRKNGHNKVYFFPIQSKSWNDHFDLINEEDIEIDAINTILAQNGLQHSSEKPIDIDLTPYQPEPQNEWLDYFNTQIKIENRIKYIDQSIKTTAYALLTYLLYSYIIQ